MASVVPPPVLGCFDVANGPTKSRESHAQLWPHRRAQLVSGFPGLVAATHPNTRTPWGGSTGRGLPSWTSDNPGGVTPLYAGQVNLKEVAPNQPANIFSPPPSAGAGAVGAPTG